MSNVAISKNNVPIRLTDERWQHITIGHPEMDPNIIYEGNYGGLIAVSTELIKLNKFIIVVYKEVSREDGFVITAYSSNKIQQFEKKEILWKKQ